MLFPEDSLARQLFQLRERSVGRAGAEIAGILDHAVEPAVDIENGALAQLAISAGGLARGKMQATDVAHPPPDGALHRFGHRSIMDANGIVEIGSHERQQLGTIVVWKTLDGGPAIVAEGRAWAVIAARTGSERNRQQQDRRALY